MTYKSAVAGTGLGGGKSVVIADPRDKSDAALRGNGALRRGLRRHVHHGGGRERGHSGSPLRPPDDLARHRPERGGGRWRESSRGDRARLLPGSRRGAARGHRQRRPRRQDRRRTGARKRGPRARCSTSRRRAPAWSRPTSTRSVSDVSRRELGAESVSPEEIYDVECDVFAPCALGGVLNDDTIPRLALHGRRGRSQQPAPRRAPARGDAARARDHLRARLRDQRRWCHQHQLRAAARAATTRSCAEQRVHEIPKTLARVFAVARERGMTTHAAAQELAEAALAEGPTVSR